jgi:hypothetical protein
MSTEISKEQALSNLTNVSLEYINSSIWGDELFEADGDEYLVLTDEEADERVKDYITESVWAFTPSFLSNHIPVHLQDKCEHLQDKCEVANDAILNAIIDFDDFVEDAVSADGRGHFLATYDGDEVEEDGYYIYRTN